MSFVKTSNFLLRFDQPLKSQIKACLFFIRLCPNLPTIFIGHRLRDRQAQASQTRLLPGEDEEGFTPSLTQASFIDDDNEEFAEPSVARSRFRLFGQVHNTFIVGLVDGELWVIDQHTAHERVNYERLGHLSPLHSRSQALLVPEVVEFTPVACEYLSGNRQELLEFGFEVEPFGSNTFQLRSVPMGLSQKRVTDTFRDLIEELVSGSVSLKHNVGESLREKLRAMTSCKAAVKAGDVLSRQDMQKLVEDMLEVEHSRYCPHGRPTRVCLDRRTLERLFHR